MTATYCRSYRSQNKALVYVYAISATEEERKAYMEALGDNAHESASDGKDIEGNVVPEGTLLYFTLKPHLHTDANTCELKLTSKGAILLKEQRKAVKSRPAKVRYVRY